MQRCVSASTVCVHGGTVDPGWLQLHAPTPLLWNDCKSSARCLSGHRSVPPAVPPAGITAGCALTTAAALQVRQLRIRRDQTAAAQTAAASLRRLLRQRLSQRAADAWLGLAPGHVWFRSRTGIAMALRPLPARAQPLPDRPQPPSRCHGHGHVPGSTEALCIWHMWLDVVSAVGATCSRRLHAGREGGQGRTRALVWRSFMHGQISTSRGERVACAGAPGGCHAPL